MATVYSHGNDIRDQEQVLTAFAEPVRRRHAYVCALAYSRGVPHYEASQCLCSTSEQWDVWHAINGLSEWDCEEAHAPWDNDFPVHKEPLGCRQAGGTRRDGEQGAIQIRHDRGRSQCI